MLAAPGPLLHLASSSGPALAQSPNTSSLLLTSAPSPALRRDPWPQNQWWQDLLPQPDSKSFCRMTHHTWSWSHLPPAFS